ncbi:MAG: hypothetical protein BWX66_01175 [Deltaproteobacteria bacterium ADurb.Bin058]|nr:MAG: hypothetical protein BWX66_01175 [Deltaproteobacteria bacterium ADurb.Bin058]
MAGITSVLAAIDPSPLGSCSFASVKGSSMTVGVRAGGITNVPKWLRTTKLGPVAKLNLGCAIQVARSVDRGHRRVTIRTRKPS